MVPEETATEVDPRIRRTRQLLLDGLENLLKTKCFDQISVQDIADAATVNRATFYDHFGDKFRLLECLVGRRFCGIISERKLCFDGGCGTALNAFALAVCDYLVNLQGPSGDRRVEPHMESAIIGVLRSLFLSGLSKIAPESAARHQIVAATAAWALYGAAREWAQTENRPPAEEIAGTIAGLVAPILHIPQAPGEKAAEPASVA
jgi:AcrR family transcriptional regulator